MSSSIVIILLFLIFIILIILKIPISFALIFATLPILFLEPRITPIMLLQRMMRSYASFILLSVPFFLLAANLMNESGITDRLIRFSKSIVGPLPGGLAHVNVFVSMIFAGLSGSSTADAAGIGSVLIPAMIKEGYDKKFTVAVTACSSVMGVIIPPSIMMIIWAGVMGTTVSGLFLAGFIPGIMIGLFQICLVFIFASKRKYPVMSKFSFKEIFVSFKSSFLALLTPLIIIGGIIGGFVTPTEASFVAVMYSLFLGVIIYRRIGFSKFLKILLDTIKLASISLFAIGAASIYGWVLSYFRIPQFLMSKIGMVTNSPTLMLCIISMIFLIVGTFMDGIPAIVILGPLLKPLAEFAGIHPLHFAIVGVVSLSFGLVTPPYGLCLLITSEIAKINCIEAIKEVGIFLLAMIIVVLVIIIFPNLTLFLPKMLLSNLF